MFRRTGETSNSAVGHNVPLQQLHKRIVEKQAIKMKGYVAVQRKLLMLIYTVWKKNEAYHQPLKYLEQPACSSCPNRAGLNPLSFFFILKVKNSVIIAGPAGTQPSAICKALTHHSSSNITKGLT
jgi:hypothetical protein